MAIEIRPEQVSPLSLYLSPSWKIMSHKISVFHPSQVRGWSSLSPCHYPSPTIVVTIQQPSGSRNPIPPSLLGSQLYNSRRPAPSCSEYKSAKWKSFQQPADFWWRSKLKALNFIVPCWYSVYDKLFIQKPKLFCYLWSVVKNPVWMRISTKQWNQCSAHRDSFVACQLLSLFKWQFVRNSNVPLFCLYFLFCLMLGLNDCNKEVNSDLNWTLVVLWCEE